MCKEENLHLMKALIFEIYSAGYVDGFNSQTGSANDLKTSYEKFYSRYSIATVTIPHQKSQRISYEEWREENDLL